MNRRTLLAAGAGLATLRPVRAAGVTRTVAGAEITLEVDGTGPDGFTERIWRWVGQSARAVQVYYGRFPVPAVYVHVILQGRAGVGGGQTFPGELPLIRMRLGPQTDDETLLKRDWVMVHEMVHLAFPWMDLKNNWMAEGLAVYVEPIARLQAGDLRRETVWGDFAEMMPRGQPGPDDRGFDVTVNWGRTYWGGAIFCLLADVRIHQQTEGRMGLQTALRAINAGRDFRHYWDFRETLAIGDEATGTSVLIGQYEDMRLDAKPADLDALWADLGVRVGDGIVTLDEGARLAAIRRAIERPKS